MKAKKIYYKRLFNLGNFSNEEIGIELEIEEGEKAIEALQKAKQFVSGLDPQNEKERKYNEAIDVLKNKESYNYKKVIESQEIVKNYEASKDEDLPF